MQKHTVLKMLIHDFSVKSDAQFFHSPFTWLQMSHHLL